MHEILKITLIGLLFGTFGTTIGGIVGANLNFKSNKILCFILEFAAGLMMSIVCFELIPEAMKLTKIFNVFIGIILGVGVMYICDDYIKEKHIDTKSNSMIKTGIIVGIGLAIHNFPEGLAIGSGFESSLKLGISLAIVICLHDIPEGRFQSRYQLKYD